MTCKLHVKNGIRQTFLEFNNIKDTWSVRDVKLLYFTFANTGLYQGHGRILNVNFYPSAVLRSTIYVDLTVFTLLNMLMTSFINFWSVMA